MSIITVEGTALVGKTDYCRIQYKKRVENNEPVGHIVFPIGEVKLHHPNLEASYDFKRYNGNSSQSIQKNMEDNMEVIERLVKDGFNLYIENWDVVYSLIMCGTGTGDLGKIKLKREMVILTDTKEVLTERYKERNISEDLIAMFLYKNDCLVALSKRLE
jgi:hypothetical protein